MTPLPCPPAARVTPPVRADDGPESTKGGPSPCSSPLPGREYAQPPALPRAGANHERYDRRTTTRAPRGPHRTTATPGDPWITNISST